MLLILLTILPLTMISIFISHPKLSKNLALIGSILNLIQILLIFENYNYNSSYFQFQLLGLFGIDGLSLWLIWLVGILLPIIVLSSNNNKLKLLLLISISYISILIFLVLDLFLFYITYEVLLIPMYYLIGFYGSRNRKISALFEFYIYTLIGSLILLFVILILYYQLGLTSFELIKNNLIDPNLQFFIFFLLIFAFGLKIPIIPLHIWLPKAHVEAPTAVSIYLAAILLKLGSYAFIRISLGLFPLGLNAISSSFIMTIGLLGIIYSSIACLTLWDFKKIIAYSSIGHMNLAILGLFSNNILGLNSSIYFMISHGLISSGLFLLIGILYDRYHTRIVKYYKGLVLILPLYSLFLAFFTLANIAFPLTSGYISEFVTFIALFTTNPFVALFSTTAIILTPLFALWFYHKIIYGKFSLYLSPTLDLSLREFHLLLPLLFFSLFFGIYPNILFNTFDIISYKFLI